MDLEVLIRERLDSDPEFLVCVSKEAVECFLSGDWDTGRALLK